MKFGGHAASNLATDLHVSVSSQNSIKISVEKPGRDRGTNNDNTNISCPRFNNTVLGTRYQKQKQISAYCSDNT